MPTTCSLCRRKIYEEHLNDSGAVQEHHLVPENRKESPKVELCRPCHKQIHAMFTNEELREFYYTVEKLQNADRLQDYLNWIRGTDKLRIDVDTSDYVRRRKG